AHSLPACTSLANVVCCFAGGGYIEEGTSMAKKPSSSKAISIGKALAKATLERRSRAIAKRRSVLAKAKPEAAPALAAARAEAVARAAAPLTHASQGVLIAEGDSWFDYPLNDVLSDLEDSYGYDVESVAHLGDTVEDM